jgi:hypothetical protein
MRYNITTPNGYHNMTLKAHPLRIFSHILHAVAMLPCMPLCIARIIAKASARLYYSKA